MFNSVMNDEEIKEKEGESHRVCKWLLKWFD
jgi:hypothetical protein